MTSVPVALAGRTPPPPSVLLRAAGTHGALPAARWIYGQTSRTKYGTFWAGCATLAAVWWTLAFTLAHVHWLALPTLISVTGYGVYRTRKAWKTSPGRRFWAVRRPLAATYLAGLFLALLVGYGHQTLAALIGITLALTLAEYTWSDSTPRAPKGWWTHGALTTAMVKAGILPKPKQGDPSTLPKLSYIGQPSHDLRGDTVTVKLPEGIAAEAVENRQKQLASALDVSPLLLQVSHDPHDPAGRVTIWVGVQHAPTVRPADLDMTPVDATQPVVIDTDPRGREIMWRTLRRHTVLVGGTDAGKTAAGKWLIRHGIRDPHVKFWCVDGKDDTDDWRPMEPLCQRFVGGAHRASVEAVRDLLLDVEAEWARRRDTPRDELPLAFVIVDEWYRIRMAARRIDRTLADELDSLMGELLATVKSRRIHFLFLVQRGVDSYLPTDMKANLLQRAVGMVAEAAEARYVLDRTPPVLPAASGEFLIAEDGKPPTLVVFPYLDPAGFREVCARGLALRATRPVSMVKAAEPAPAMQGDPFLAAVLAALTDGPLAAATLLERLPAHVRPDSPGNLGKLLGKLPAGLVERTTKGAKSPRWTLAASAVNPRGEGREPEIHAQTGLSRPEPSHPSLIRSLP